MKIFEMNMISHDVFTQTSGNTTLLCHEIIKYLSNALQHVVKRKHLAETKLFA